MFLKKKSSKLFGVFLTLLALYCYTCALFLPFLILKTATVKSNKSINFFYIPKILINRLFKLIAIYNYNLRARSFSPQNKLIHSLHKIYNHSQCTLSNVFCRRSNKEPTILVPFDDAVN